MNINKVPKGKTVYIKGRKFKSGDILPPWALIEIPEIPEVKEEKKEIVFDKKDIIENVEINNNFKESKNYNYGKSQGSNRKRFKR